MAGSKGFLIVSVLTAALSLCACGSDDDDGESITQPLAILSAFPAEMAPLVEEAVVHETVVVNDRIFRVGTLRGAPVVIGLTGIGLVNAETTTRALLAQFEISGAIYSGVAGSPLRIGDVTVPALWALDGGGVYESTPAWLDLASETVVPGAVALDQCTEIPANPSETVCLPDAPAIVTGGIGFSSDPFQGTPVGCLPGPSDVFACDIETEGTPAPTTASLPAEGAGAGAIPENPIAVDMETSIVAREMAERGLPFIAFRAVSDGAGDPLNLPGFPAQFFAYYRLAARNAAAATIAFVERLALQGD